MIPGWTATLDLVGNGSGSGDGDDENIYCGQSWAQFWDGYNRIYEPTLFFLSVIGLFTNLLNLAVFTRKNMRNPTITVLTALTVADLLCVGRMLQWIVYRWIHVVTADGWQSRGFVVTLFVNACLHVIFHAAAVYLTLAVAVWRYLMVLQPLKSRSWATSRNAKITIFTSVIFTTIVSLGAMGNIFRIIKLEGYENVDDEQSQFTLDKQAHTKMALIFYGLLIKFIPCCILTVVSIGLVRSLLKARKTRARLLKCGTIFYKLPADVRNASNKSEAGNSGLDKLTKKNMLEPRRASVGAGIIPDGRKNSRVSSGSGKNWDNEFDRTTWMLLVVLILFLMTEGPGAVAGILAGVLEKFYPGVVSQCYLPTLNFMLLCGFLSSIPSFFVYVTTSAKFRATLLRVIGFYWPGDRGPNLLVSGRGQRSKCEFKERSVETSVI